MLKFAKFAAVALVLGFTTVEGYSVSEAHKARLEQQATRDRIDTLIGVERDLLAAVNPKAKHAICPAKDGRPEVDMGAPFDCPNKDDGQCLKTPKGETLPVSVAGARCEAGKL
jgi:hypothetical protein